ncbi:hypothetical protein ACVWY3_007766 [Bradyrhizobium sp. USDA 4486]
MTKSYLELYQRLLAPDDYPVPSYETEVHA